MVGIPCIASVCFPVSLETSVAVRGGLCTGFHHLVWHLKVCVCVCNSCIQWRTDAHALLRGPWSVPRPMKPGVSRLTPGVHLVITPHHFFRSRSFSSSASPNGCFLGMYYIRIYVCVHQCLCVCLPPFVTLFPLLPSCCVYVPANGLATGRGFPYQWLCEHSQTSAQHSG